ncbi:MAG: hypothetical protein CL811_05045 [Colwelliaceae bacterium]|nr:hypothetical protein [Colwelliaceae bacterium]
MKQFTRLQIVCFLFILFTHFPVLAAWHQGSAQRQINTIQYEEIRTQTIKDAIANATFKSGSYIQAEDIMLDGVLKSSKTLIRTEGQIRRVEIVSESVDQGILTVIVKVDVQPISNCTKDNYAKSLLITQLPLLKPMQAQHGALFEFGEQTSKRLEKQLSQDDKLSVTTLLDKVMVSLNPVIQLDKAYLNKVGKYLATEFNVQFILLGGIRDIGLFDQVKDNLLIDDVLLRRNFTLELFVYDALKGDVVLENSYHGEANWDFARNDVLDMNNSLFWRSDYGRVVLHTINDAVTDVSDALKCQQSLAQIVSNQGDFLVVSMGEKQGVQVGDEFELIKQRVIEGAQQQHFNLLTKDTSFVLRVAQVSADSSVLVSPDGRSVGDNQLLNLVSPKYAF